MSACDIPLPKFHKFGGCGLVVPLWTRQWGFAPRDAIRINKGSLGFKMFSQSLPSTNMAKHVLSPGQAKPVTVLSGPVKNLGRMYRRGIHPPNFGAGVAMPV